MSLLSSVHNSRLSPSQHADSLPSLSHTQASFMTSELLQKALTSSLVASLMAQMVTNLLAMQETRSKFWVGKIPWRREWQPTPVFFPGETRGQRSLAGYSPWGCKESDMTERLTLQALLWFLNVCRVLFVPLFHRSHSSQPLPPSNPQHKKLQPPVTFLQVSSFVIHRDGYFTSEVGDVHFLFSLSFCSSET